MTAPPADAHAAAPVRRRQVLFFGGFDPKGAMYYHALYARHAALQSAVNGLALEVGPRRRDARGHMFWEVRAAPAGGAPCDSRIECVAWDATVRRHWPATSWRLVWQVLLAYARILRHGCGQMLRMARIMPRALFATFYPLIYFAGGGLLSALAAFLSALLVQWLSGSAVAGLPVAVTVFVLLWRIVLKLEKKLETTLLARIFAFVTAYAVRGLPELDREISTAAARIVELARERDCDEILVVGYSVGSLLATRAMAQALASLGAAPAPRCAVSLLTLGNCIPLLALFPQAAQYRNELAALAESDLTRWVDVSSPTDWGSAAMQDPIEVCNIPTRSRGSGWPMMTSPRFHALFAAETYRRMISDKHQMHGRYLMSTEIAGRYDFFAITAGPALLGQRYASLREPR